MTWAFIPPIAAWIVGAVLCWLFGSALVGASAAGRRALPIVAALWPMASIFLVLVALWAGFEALVARGLAQVFGDEDRA
jgi:hypothetical protein